MRYRYEQLRRFPAGLLVIGDAVCSFNPVYGQDMTAAAMEAAALRDLVRDGSLPTYRTYFRRIAKVVDIPWEIAGGADLAFPGVPGKRTAKMRMVNAYVPRVHAAASTDSSLARAFVRVMGMVDRPEGCCGRIGRCGCCGHTCVALHLRRRPGWPRREVRGSKPSNWNKTRSAGGTIGYSEGPYSPAIAASTLQGDVRGEHH